ncbi:MAG: copper-containing nitrite reductase [Candidatus Pacebacteria bacterium]|nr:copper-containing nitrite reductase [Candidatus Paceibacterota bacterium]
MFNLLIYSLLQTIGFFILVVAAIALLTIILLSVSRRLKIAKKIVIPAIVVLVGVFLLFFSTQEAPRQLKFPLMLKTFGPAGGPELPIKSVFTFLKNINNFERVDIARDPADIPPPINRKEPTEVKVEIETKEVIAEIAPGVYFNYWTFGGQVPGPFVRVREGDTVALTLKNNPSSLHHHSIDLHAVNGPGGGATVTMVAPGESKTFRFKALNPGLYVYHCAYPNVGTHMAHGMYGMILVEPKEGLPPVDKEFYVMQGEFYSAGRLGKKGLQVFDAGKMVDNHPEYIVFNGKTKSINGNIKANVGEKIRFFVGNGGVNLISSFHLIGEIFDKVYPEGAVGSEPFANVQTTAVPAGGATIAEFKLDYPGKYILVDHALARLDKGAWGVMEASGEANKEIFDGEMGNLEESGH